MVPSASDRCEVAGCSMPAAAAYAVQFEGARPVQYVSLCMAHNRRLICRHGSAAPDVVLAYVAAAAQGVVRAM